MPRQLSEKSELVRRVLRASQRFSSKPRSKLRLDALNASIPSGNKSLQDWQAACIVAGAVRSSGGCDDRSREVMGPEEVEQVGARLTLLS
jgi:hypothetical protein